MRDTLGTIINEKPLKAEIRCPKCGKIYCSGILSSKSYHKGEIIKINSYGFCSECGNEWEKFFEKNYSSKHKNIRSLYERFLSEKVQFT